MLAFGNGVDYFVARTMSSEEDHQGPRAPSVLGAMDHNQNCCDLNWGVVVAPAAAAAAVVHRSVQSVLVRMHLTVACQDQACFPPCGGLAGPGFAHGDVQQRTAAFPGIAGGPFGPFGPSKSSLSSSLSSRLAWAALLLLGLLDCVRSCIYS